MKTVRLLRVEESVAGTIGILLIDAEVFCFTLEQDDEENIKNESSIPAQQYICKKVKSQKFGNTFEVTNVPGRSHILFHRGNLIEDTKGCILLGRNVGSINGKRGIEDSGNTFKKFMDIMKREDSFRLTIVEVY